MARFDPRVSVVLPVFNEEKTVARSIRSALRQTFRDFELIVVDGGSTDGTFDALNSMKPDDRVRLIREEHNGLSGARKKGLLEAKGELLAFLRAGDEWMPSFLERVVGMWQKFPQCAAFGTGYIACEGGKVVEYPDLGKQMMLGGEVIPDRLRERMTQPDVVGSSFVLIKRKVLDDRELFPSGVGDGGAAECWTKIVPKYPVAWTPMRCVVDNLDARGEEGRMPGSKQIPETAGDGKQSGNHLENGARHWWYDNLAKLWLK